MKLCIKYGCKLVLYVVLHKIAKKTDINETIKWGADHIVGKFNHFLELNNETGIVVVDRLSDVKEYKLLVEKFTKGLILEKGAKQTLLENIKLFTSSCNNASHLNSLMDISLGAFRYCINRPNEDVAKKIMENLIKLIWADKVGENTLDPWEKGLTFRPEKRTSPAYDAEYKKLADHINMLIKDL